jgi:soluble lytic murein transglycosylase-like protein
MSAYRPLWRLNQACMTLVMVIALCWAAAPLGAVETAASDPYTAAASASGVPLEVLVAIAGAESAYHPWALNVGGREIYSQSAEEASRLLSVLGDNIDIGLMQINFRVWGKRLGLSKQQLLDPATNLMAGARILSDCLSHRGDLWKRIGTYHSSKPHLRSQYNQLVYQAYLKYVHDDIH